MHYQPAKVAFIRIPFCMTLPELRLCPSLTLPLASTQAAEVIGRFFLKKIKYCLEKHEVGKQYETI